MAKRIVNKAERNAERYDAKETGYRLFEDSQNGKTFDRLMPLIVSEQNIILAYRNICKNSGSKTPGTDGKAIVAIQSLPIESVIKTVRNKLNYYQPKKVRRVEIPKDNGKTRPLGIPSIWDRLIQQCILQILEPICEAKFHERNNGFRPYRSTQNAIAQCYKMAQLQNLHANSSSAEEYASDKLESGIDEVVHDGAYAFDKAGRKGLETTKENIRTAKDGIQRFKQQRAEQSLRKQASQNTSSAIKTVDKAEKTIKQFRRGIRFR